MTLVEMLMAARAILEVDEGRVVSTKTLVNEVAPDIVSEATTLRVVREMLRKEWLVGAAQQDDGRSLRLTYTRALYDCLASVFG